MIAARVEGADSGSLRTAVDKLKSRFGSAIIVLAAVESPTKVLLVAGVTADRNGVIKAGELVGAVAAQSAARAAAARTSRRPEAAIRLRWMQRLASVVTMVRARLSA